MVVQIPAAVAYGIYTLGGVIVRATTKKIAERLIKGGFRKASEGVAKSKANITNATDNNIISLITRGIKGARTSTKGPITQGSGRNKPRIIRRSEPKSEQSATQVPKTRRVIDSKFDKSQAMSSFDRTLGGRIPKDTKLGSGMPKTSPFSRVKTSKPTSKKLKVPTALGEAPEIDLKPIPKAPEKKKTSPKKTVAPKGEKKSGANKSTKEQKVTRPTKKQDFGKLLYKAPAKEAGFTVDKAPPASVLNKVAPKIRPRARPETVKKAKKELSAFGKAFKSARAAKKYSFKFKGKEITTRYKEETVAEHKKKFLKKK